MAFLSYIKGFSTSGNMIPLSASPLRNPAVFSRTLSEGEMVLVNGDNAASLALTNQVAVLIWDDLVDGERSAGAIVEEIKSRFQQVPENVVDDILALLEKLAQGGFIGFEWKPENNGL